MPTDPPPFRDARSSMKYAVTLHTMQMHGNDLIQSDEISCDVLAEPPAANVCIVPHRRLSVVNDDGTPVVYQVSLYCGYWTGADADTTRILFTIHSRFRALANARSLNDDSTPLNSELFVSPVRMPTGGFSISTPLTISAIETLDAYQFDHWTSNWDGTSNTAAVYDPYGRAQIITPSCWPMRDTVMFTAWYRNTTRSNVAVNDGHTLQPPRTTVAMCIPENGTIALYDLQGRALCIPCGDVWQQAGTYVARVTRSDGVCTTKLLLITN